MTIYRANANELTKDQLISIINKQTEAMLEIESEITTLKQRESKLVEALKLYANKYNWSRLYERQGVIGRQVKNILHKDGGTKAREVLKELGGRGMSRCVSCGEILPPLNGSEESDFAIECEYCEAHEEETYDCECEHCRGDYD